MSHPSFQSKSKPPTPSARSTVRSVDALLHATEDHLIDLWDSFTGNTFKVPLLSDTINRHILSQHTKSSPVLKARSRTAVAKVDILSELLLGTNCRTGNLVKLKDTVGFNELVISPKISDS
ncbi:unnamed protein product [Trichobilharzia regenti]|nr:unnamed protein product [Trichobilharzia regenti]